ncbi:MAG: hypothetical protein V3U75_05535 [Methylococcaceae bacterium]
MKKFLFVMLINLFGLSFVVTADDGVYKKSIANFGEDLMVIPCVEVEASNFNGYYNVLMEATGDKSGFDWRVKEVTSASEANCERDSTEDNSMQDVLNATGLGSDSDSDGRADDSDDPDDDSDNPNDIEEPIEDIDSLDDTDELIDDSDSSDDLDDDMDDPNEDEEIGDDTNDEGSSY